MLQLCDQQHMREYGHEKSKQAVREASRIKEVIYPFPRLLEGVIS